MDERSVGSFKPDMDLDTGMLLWATLFMCEEVWQITDRCRIFLLLFVAVRHLSRSLVLLNNCRGDHSNL